MERTCTKKITSIELLKHLETKLDDIREEIKSAIQNEVFEAKTCSTVSVHRISVKCDGLYLDDHKIINKSNRLFFIAKILINHYVYECFHGKQYLPTTEILEHLENIEKGHTQLSDENIYTSISKLNSCFKLFTSDPIIENKKGKGYRLNDNVFITR